MNKAIWILSCGCIGLQGAAVMAAPEIVGVSVPFGSQLGSCYVLADGVYSASAPINTSLGIGHLLDPGPISPPSFTLHDAGYVSPFVPDPSRAVVTFQFDVPAVVDQIELIQHANGFTALEGFVGDSPESLSSIGTVFGPAGDVTGYGFFVEGQSYVFDFDNSIAGTYFEFVVRKTNFDGYANYRAFPRSEDGTRFGLHDAPFVPPTQVVPEPGTYVAVATFVLTLCVTRRRQRTPSWACW